MSHVRSPEIPRAEQVCVAHGQNASTAPRRVLGAARAAVQSNTYLAAPGVTGSVTCSGSLLATKPLAKRCRAIDVSMAARKVASASDHTVVWAEFD